MTQSYLYTDTNTWEQGIRRSKLTQDDSNTTSSMPTLRGPFLGFTYIVPPVIENDEIVGHRIDIAYQVQLRNVNVPAFNGSLCGWGPVRSTRLQFIADQQKNDTQTALETLLDDDKHVDLVAQLEDFITTTTFDHKQLQQVGITLREYLDQHGADVSGKQRDALLDLVRARLRAYMDEQFMVDVPVLLVPAGNNQGTPAPLQPGFGIEGRTQVKDVTFGPHFYENGDTYAFTDTQNALYVTIDHPDRKDEQGNPFLLLVPIESINTLHVL